MKFSFLKTENKWFVLIFTICAVLIIVIGLNHFYLKTNQETISLQEVPAEEESLEVPSVETPMEQKFTQEEPLLEAQPSHAESPQEESPSPQETPKVKAVPSLPQEPPPVETKQARFIIQVASFRDKAKANTVVEKLKQEGFSAYTMSKDLAGQGVWYRVWIGDFSTKEEATKMLDKVRKKYKDSFIKPL